MARGGPLGEGTQTDSDQRRVLLTARLWGAEAELSDQQSAEISTLKTTIAQLASMIIF